jgi:hypothetical protein
LKIAKARLEPQTVELSAWGSILDLDFVDDANSAEKQLNVVETADRGDGLKRKIARNWFTTSRYAVLLRILTIFESLSFKWIKCLLIYWKARRVTILSIVFLPD